MTYEAIIDNYCRAEFVSRVKIESKESRGQDQALVLKKSKRYYKKENITKKERSGMTPLIVQGSSCQCDAITDTSKRYLLMGAHRGEDLVVNYVVEFQRKDKDFRKAFKDIRKGNVCNTIIQELSAGDIEKNTEKDKDDGVCNACRMPLKYNTMVENYCLADFVLRVKVKSLEARDSHQALVLKKSRKNFKKGAISRKEEKAMVPLLDGREGCTCELVNNDKSRYLIFGNKRDDQYYITYVIEFAKRDPEFKKALRAIRKHTACLGILQGTGLGVDPEDDATDDKKKGKGKKRRKKGKKGKKGRKGKKKRKDKKAKKSTSAENSDNSA
ncbi:uncharacterized protein [Littorina saxatilis]|uniref:uncharacterized protein n=1 Tax=Littorina saxatilis TaxID=31220 RepID=UPI0038B51D3E